PSSTLFPYTTPLPIFRIADAQRPAGAAHLFPLHGLVRQRGRNDLDELGGPAAVAVHRRVRPGRGPGLLPVPVRGRGALQTLGGEDRKSTRLNSSHLGI